VSRARCRSNDDFCASAAVKDVAVVAGRVAVREMRCCSVDTALSGPQSREKTPPIPTACIWS
jgi:hypothetical protein